MAFLYKEDENSSGNHDFDVSKRVEESVLWYSDENAVI